MAADPDAAMNASADRLTVLASRHLGESGLPAPPAPTPGPTLTSNSSTACRAASSGAAAPVARSTGTIVACSASVAPSRARSVPRCPGQARFSIRVSPGPRPTGGKATPCWLTCSSRAATWPLPKLPRRGKAAAAAGAVEHNTRNRSRCPALAAQWTTRSAGPRGSTPLGRAARWSRLAAGGAAGLTSVAGAIFLPVPWRSRRRPAKPGQFLRGPGAALQLDLQLADPKACGALHPRRRAQPAAGARPAGVPGCPGPLAAPEGAEPGRQRRSLMRSQAQASRDGAGARQGLQHDLQPLTWPPPRARQPAGATAGPEGFASTHGTSPEEQRVGGQRGTTAGPPRTYRGGARQLIVISVPGRGPWSPPHRPQDIRGTRRCPGMPAGGAASLEYGRRQQRPRLRVSAAASLRLLFSDLAEGGAAAEVRPRKAAPSHATSRPLPRAA